MEKIVVIGANHAGTAALNTILDQYPGKEVVAFDGNSNISFLGCGMALWIGKQIPSSDGLFYSDKATLEKKGAKIYMETLVDRIDYDNKIVYATGKDGSSYTQPYDKLILATGSNPVNPKIEGTHLKNVQFVKLFQNAQDVIQKLQDPTIRKVAVVGAGYIGVELAEAFKRNGREVLLIDHEESCLNAYYDDIFTKRMGENLANHGVDLKLGEDVVRINGTEKVEQIVTTKGTYDVDMVVLCIGFTPNTALSKNDLALYKNGAILVDKHQETSRPGVYAIGDCATVFDNVTGESSYIALASNALRSGILAAHNACGTEIESPGVQGSNGISIWGYHMISTGVTLKKAKELGFTDAVVTDYEDLQKPAFITENNYPVLIRIVYDQKTRRILGAQIASEQDIDMAIHLFSLAIQEKFTIDKLKLLDLFFLPHFNQPYNYITMAALSAK